MTKVVQRSEDDAPRVAGTLTLKVAAILTGGLAISLAMAPDALARIAMNHSEGLV